MTFASVPFASPLTYPSTVFTFELYFEMFNVQVTFCFSPSTEPYISYVPQLYVLSFKSHSTFSYVHLSLSIE